MNIKTALFLTLELLSTITPSNSPSSSREEDKTSRAGSIHKKQIEYFSPPLDLPSSSGISRDNLTLPHDTPLDLSNKTPVSKYTNGENIVDSPNTFNSSPQETHRTGDNASFGSTKRKRSLRPENEPASKRGAGVLGQVNSQDTAIADIVSADSTTSQTDPQNIAKDVSLEKNSHGCLPCSLISQVYVRKAPQQGSLDTDRDGLPLNSDFPDEVRLVRPGSGTCLKTLPPKYFFSSSSSCCNSCSTSKNVPNSESHHLNRSCKHLETPKANAKIKGSEIGLYFKDYFPKYAFFVSEAVRSFKGHVLLRKPNKKQKNNAGLSSSKSNSEATPEAHYRIFVGAKNLHACLVPSLKLRKRLKDGKEVDKRIRDLLEADSNLKNRERKFELFEDANFSLFVFKVLPFERPKVFGYSDYFYLMQKLMEYSEAEDRTCSQVNWNDFLKSISQNTRKKDSVSKLFNGIELVSYFEMGYTGIAKKKVIAESDNKELGYLNFFFETLSFAYKKRSDQSEIHSIGNFRLRIQDGLILRPNKQTQNTFNAFISLGVFVLEFEIK